jgi:hypothetical protein
MGEEGRPQGVIALQRVDEGLPESGKKQQERKKRAGKKGGKEKKRREKRNETRAQLPEKK